MESLLAAGGTSGPSWAVFVAGAVMILAGGLGVVLLRTPVHCALMLVTTLFGVALEFINESADFLAAVQVIVYAGAVVILFLFVIMYLGVERRDTSSAERTRVQRPLALLLGVMVLVEVLLLARVHRWSSGIPSRAGALNGSGENVQKLGESIFTRYLLPFEMTAALLVVAVVAAVVLSRAQHQVAGEMTRAEQEEAVGQAVAAQAPAGQSPVGQAVAGQSPAGQSPAGQSPAGQAPAGQAPAGQAPAGQAPAGQGGTE